MHYLKSGLLLSCTPHPSLNIPILKCWRTRFCAFYNGLRDTCYALICLYFGVLGEEDLDIDEVEGAFEVGDEFVQDSELGEGYCTVEGG